MLVVSSCSKQEFEDDLATDIDDKSNQASLRDKDDSVYEVKYILEYLKANRPIDWTKERDAKLLYSIGFYTDFSYIIGYKPKGFADFENGLSVRELSNTTWKNARKNILSAFDFDKNDILQESGDDLFPAVLVESRSVETMEHLMKMDELNYVEPQTDIFLLMFDKELQASIELTKGPKALPVGRQIVNVLNNVGCGCGEPTPPPMNDASLIQPGVKMPWNYFFNGIDENVIDENGNGGDPSTNNAWNKSTGDNIGVAVIDSGVSFEQENLDGAGQFFDMVGLSFNRIEQRRDFLGAEFNFEVTIYPPAPNFPGGGVGFLPVESPIIDGREAHDRCGHGTRQAGLIAAPRGFDGNAVGIAYNCDLYNYRALHNPLILTIREKLAVGSALMAAGQENNIKIISMAAAQFPGSDPSPSILCGINMAYGQGKMIICAAGTNLPLPILPGMQSDDFVLFPANHLKTIAVTGIQIPAIYPAPLGSDAVNCHDCFAGPEVNFAVIMEDGDSFADGRTTLAVTCSGDIPDYVSGSSSATGSLSGMAALIWAKLGSSANRGQVLERMRLASSNPNVKHPTLGHGYIIVEDALF